MSIAARRSHRGDEYQLRVATHWLIRLLEDDDVESVLVEAIAAPDSEEKVTVDDIVVQLRDGSTIFIQAKENQQNHRQWRLSDAVLQRELVAARDQLEKTKTSTVEFYSGTPFGQLGRLAKECQLRASFEALSVDSADSLVQSLSELADVLHRSPEATFDLLKRFRIGDPHHIEGWDHANRARLRPLVTNASVALMVLEKTIRDHQAGLASSGKTVLLREDLTASLEKAGIFLSPNVDTTTILREFSNASRIGRNWIRTIANETIPRADVEELTSWLETNERGSVLLSDGPGSGKTCVLLSIADYVERKPLWALLFIKGDLFARCSSESDLAAGGLPSNLVEKCACLARQRRVIVIVDSLDVLSLHREHQSLRLLLSLLDRLQQVDRVVTVMACRTFDLKYDPQLRDRRWNRKVPLRPLEFETDVKPLLRRLNVDIAGISPELGKLLTIPQNLRLYADIATSASSTPSISLIRTGYELQAIYLEVMVRRDALLGDDAIAALEAVAERMMSDRTLRVPRAMLNLDDECIQRLVSQRVLLHSTNDTFQFGHQTLLDMLTARRALAQGMTLASFILSHPPFPFIRPTVQGFVRHLRPIDARMFGRQLRAAVNNVAVAYHLKRAIVETVAELAPTSDDWPVIRFLWKEHADLFFRMIGRAHDAAWFRLLAERWWPSLGDSADDQGARVRFINMLDRWMNEFPNEVLEQWRTALKSSWGASSNLAWTIQVQLKSFERWETDGVEGLLEALVDGAVGDQELLCAVVSRFVEATGRGDKLLWTAISKEVTPEDRDGLQVGQKLRCGPHHLCRTDFLQSHLARSDAFLDAILAGLAGWFPVNGKLSGALLHNTAWMDTHSAMDFQQVDNLRILMDALGEALRSRCQSRSAWWLHREPELRHTNVLGIRYIVLLCYAEDPEGNRKGIEAQLLDSDLIRCGQLDYELGVLTRIAYPHISDQVQLEHQILLLERYEELAKRYGDGPGNAKSVYSLLRPIPAVLRTAEVQRFLEHWEAHFGTGPLEPTISMWSGIVPPPAKADQILRLGDDDLYRLLYHYEGAHSKGDSYDANMVGGQEELGAELAQAASIDPERYLSQVERWWREGRDVEYIAAVLRGVGDHLEFRFGNRKASSEWAPVEPLPASNAVVDCVFSAIERYGVLWNNECRMARVVAACVDAVETPELADRATWLLIRLARSREPVRDRVRIDPHKRSEPGTMDLLHDALNAPRGIAAGAAVSLANRLLNADERFPELLVPMLKRFASDSVASVRAAVLQRLPFLLQREPDLGWELLDRLLCAPQPHLWEVAERSLHYQLPKSFDRVRPFLDRILAEAPVVAGETWGRLAMLACLYGHIDISDVLTVLEREDAQPLWSGAVAVLATNLDKPDCAHLCRVGVLRALAHRPLPKRILQVVDRHVGGFGGRQEVHDVVFAALDVVGAATGRLDLLGLFDWIGAAASRDPIGTLPLLEKLVYGLETRADDIQFLHSEPLVAALLDISREADESDDRLLIQRAVALQDAYLRLNIRGMEEMLEQAGARN